MNKSIRIKDKLINEKSSTFIIAEISANHNGILEDAKKLIKEAYKAGADAVKLQTYTADTITIDCDNEYFRINNNSIWDGLTLYKLYEKAYTPWQWHKNLFEFANDLGIICFSTPFDFTSVDFLEELNTPAYKIASFEITDIPLIEYIASKGKPLIVSTGIATLEEIKEVISVCEKVGNDKVILLKCTSSYPASFEEMNLRCIKDIEQKFNTLIGLSDHSLGIEVPIAAVTLGAKIIEKHIKLQDDSESADSKFSLSISMFKNMVNSIRNVEKALGNLDYSLSESNINNRIFARSLFIVKDVKKGELITKNNVKSIRPSYGLEPKFYEDILGKRFKECCLKGTPLKWELIEK